MRSGLVCQSLELKPMAASAKGERRFRCSADDLVRLTAVVPPAHGSRVKWLGKVDFN